MKVLCVHNYYGLSALSGENVVFESEIELLKRRGHEVVTFLRFSDSISSKGVLGTLQGAISTPWNPWSAAAIRHEVDRFQPDVVHVHNTFPPLSPAIFRYTGHRSTRVTLHNYRLFCPAAIPMREGNVCTECLDRASRRGLHSSGMVAIAEVAWLQRRWRLAYRSTAGLEHGHVM